MSEAPNPNGANQFQLDPRQLLCWNLYVSPRSATFGNAKQSAIKAGYEEDYGDQITSSEWFKRKYRRMNMVAKGEKVLEETLDMDCNVPIISMFGPVIDKETKQPYMKVDTGILKIKQDSAKFVTSTLGKAEGYTTRTEVTGADGEELKITIVNYGDKPAV